MQGQREGTQDERIHGRTRWVSGYMEEQSTQGLLDFLKQRRRWFLGLVKVCLHAPVSFKWRLSLSLNTLSYLISPFAYLYTVFHFAFGSDVILPVQILANFSFASYATMYIIGLQANMMEHGTPLWRWPIWIFLQIVLFPVFSLLETVAILFALIRPTTGFHVVKK